ncbi:MAG: hypothetical protein M3R53_02530 [Candidatus Eremiobacteraeota bacterium]|nr:hypothetical protein [Candidatus Eremiobacteraeota bacterium]
MATLVIELESFDAAADFVRLIDRVVDGETIRLVRKGLPVAEICPVDRLDSERVRSVLQRIEERRSRVKPDPDGWTVDDYLKDGRLGR